MGGCILAACGDGASLSDRDDGDGGIPSGDAGGAPEERQCDEAAARLGHPACLHRIVSDAEWQAVSLPVDLVDQVRATKYFVPVTDGARLKPLFVDAHYYTMHYDFMVEAFGELFEPFDTAMYLKLLFDPALREYFVGEVIEYLRPGGEPLIGFYVVGDTATPELVGCGEIQRVYEELTGRMSGFELAVVPFDAAQRSFIDRCRLPVFDPFASLEYELYHHGVGYGIVRRHTRSSLADAQEDGALGWQDIVAVDEAPFDIEVVVSGVVTGTRQSPLSHLGVRSASRGTPNCYRKDATEYLGPWEGKLVKMTCGLDNLTVSEATREEAEAFWAGLRPAPVTLPEPDVTFTDLVALHDIPVQDADGRRLSLTRFGAKARNLAWLYRNVNPDLQLGGFGIPVAHYRSFIDTNSWTVDLGDGPETLAFAETIERLLAHPSFRSDGRFRRERLAALRGAMNSSPCDDALLMALASKIVEVFGGEEIMIRFRSSSNAEDDLRFNGAGLYDSTSACLADALDGDDQGPSRCDEEESAERDICRALKTVWSSLWESGAYEEREWYGIDHERAAMGILVNTRTKAEQANIVAFTGNPLALNDARYLVSAQTGDLDAVSSEPGTWPEQALLTLTDGAVSGIDYTLSSSELPEGEHVLSTTQLKEMGAILYELAGIYPIDAPAPEEGEVYLDTEWKVTSAGRLVIKQIRPFLKTRP